MRPILRDSAIVHGVKAIFGSGMTDLSTPNVDASPAEALTPSGRSTTAYTQIPLGELPEYTRSLLHIRVPVLVTLAQNRQPLGRILELGPGSIIQFEKSCEEMLELSVGEHRIASGEAVKVGDKFGLRITSVILPEERFRAVTPKQRMKDEG